MFGINKDVVIKTRDLRIGLTKYEYPLRNKVICYCGKEHSYSKKKSKGLSVLVIKKLKLIKRRMK